MQTYLIKRTLLMIVTLFGVTIVNFIIIHLAPGKPGERKSLEDIEKGLQASAGKSNEERMRKEFHLDKPVIINLRPYRDYQSSIEDWVALRSERRYERLWEALIALKEAEGDRAREAALERVEEIADEWRLKTLVESARFIAVDKSWLDLYELYESNISTLYYEAEKRTAALDRWAVPHLMSAMNRNRDLRFGLLVALVAARHYRGNEWTPLHGQGADETAGALAEFEGWWFERDVTTRTADDAVVEWADERRLELLAIDRLIGEYLRQRTKLALAGEGGDAAVVAAKQASVDEVRAEIQDRLSPYGIGLPDQRIDALVASDRGRTLQVVRWEILHDVARKMAERSEIVGRNDLADLIDVYLDRRDPDVLQVVVNSLATIQDNADEFGIYAGATDERKREKRHRWERWWEENRHDYRYDGLEKVRYLLTDTQYFIYVSNLARLDLGGSIKQKGKKVTDLIWEHFQRSFALMFLSTLAIYLFAVPIGIYSAVRRGSVLDRFLMIVLFILYSVPSYVGAVFLTQFLTIDKPFSIFPTDRLASPDAYRMTALGKLADYAHHLVLPVFCLTYTGLASISRYARVGMLDVIRQDYIRTARAKGLSERVVVLKHALRNGVIPLITLFANLLPVMIGGSVIIETIFSIKGMGYLAFHSITERDYTTLMGINFITAVLVMMGILVSDLLYALVDPQISLD